MKVYHGSYLFIPKPSLEFCSPETDFGLAFYLTEDYFMAEKWACRKKTSIITEYDFELEGLSKYDFKLDSKWLDFVVKNRSLITPSFDASPYDLLTGPTADDKLYATIEQYEDGLISERIAIEAMNCMKIGTQIALKTEKSLSHLHNPKEIIINPERKQQIRAWIKIDREKANKRTKIILQNHNKKKGRF